MSDNVFERDGQWFRRSIGEDGQPFDAPTLPPGTPDPGEVIEIRPAGRGRGLGSSEGDGIGAPEPGAAPSEADSAPAQEGAETQVADAGAAAGGGVDSDAMPLPLPPPARPRAPRQPPAGRSDYEDYRAERNTAETLEAARERRAQRQRERQPPAPVQPEPPRTPEQRAAERDNYAQRRAAELVETRPSTPEGDNLGLEVPERGPRQPARVSETQSTARTIVRNAAEAVTGIPRGVLAAFASLFEAADDLADWMSGTTPESMPNTPGRMIGRGIRYLQPGREPETISGRVAEELAQFVTGFLRGQMTLRRYGVLQGGGGAMQVARGLAAGAIADGLYNEAGEENLAAIWQRAGLPANALTDFLATAPDDDAASNRLRNVAIGALSGAALEGVIAAARATRAALAARREARAVGAAQQAPTPSLAASAAAEAGPDALRRVPRTPIPGTFPRVVHQGVTDIRALPDHAAAKAGDLAAASRLVDGVYDPGRAAVLRPLAEGNAAPPLLVPVMPPDPTGRNVLPLAYARRLAADLGWQVDTGIVRQDTARRTDASGLGRVVSGARFEGAVVPGRRYVLVDDVVTQGGTLADLRAFIESRGGQVVAATALQAPGVNSRLAIPADILADLRRRAGAAENLWRELTGFGFDALTESEARMLARFGDAQALSEAIREELGRQGVARYVQQQTLAEAAGVAPNAARDVLIVGDPLRPLVEMGPRGDPARRLAEGMGATSDAALGVDAVTAARGLVAGSAQPVEQVANSAALRSAGDVGPVFINWGRIQSGEDVQAVLRDMAEAYRPAINEAAGGVQTNEATRQLADQLGLTVEQLLSRQQGEVWNAATATAARDLYVASGQRLLEAARAAAAPGAGALEAAAFRRMMGLHYAIQAQVLGARREAGRAVQAWAIPARAGGAQMRMIEDLLESSGGVDTAQAMARRLAILADNLPADEVARAVGQFTNRGAFGRSLEAVQQVWINALLSSPATHLANIFGNTLNIPLSLMERATQAGVGAVRGGEDAALAGEAPVMIYALLTGFRDALRLAARTYGDDGQEVARLIGRQDLPRQGAISSQAWGVDAGSGLGRALDFVGHEVVSAPGRAMGAEDAFFKSIIYRMELHAQALRHAVREAPRRADGTADPEAVGRIMGEVMRAPPEAVQRAAADEALYRTFNRQAGPIAQRLLMLRNSDSAGWNLFMATVLPFIRTPANLISYSLERTPLAPVVGQWRADVAAGGARRDAALARVALGSLILAHTFQMAEAGLITGSGPDDPREREALQRTGWQPYSLRIGDTYVSFNRLDPFGFLFGAMGDLHELLTRRDLGEREEVEARRLIAGFTSFLSDALMERTYFSGLANLMQAFDADRGGLGPYLDRTAGSLLVPGIFAAAGAVADPNAYDRGQGWLTQRLGSLMNAEAIPRRNIWGEALRRPGVDELGRVGAALTPVRISSMGSRPIDREIARLGMGLQGVDTNGTVVLGGATVNLRELNPRALDRLRVLFGNELKLPGMGNLGLADALDEMVQGRGPMGAAYLRASDEGRERAIRETAQRYRAAARAALLADPQFRDVAEFVARAAQRENAGRGEVPVPSLDRLQDPEGRNRTSRERARSEPVTVR